MLFIFLPCLVFTYFFNAVYELSTLFILNVCINYDVNRIEYVRNVRIFLEEFLISKYFAVFKKSDRFRFFQLHHLAFVKQFFEGFLRP